MSGAGGGCLLQSGAPQARAPLDARNGAVVCQEVEPLVPGMAEWDCISPTARVWSSIQG